VGRHSPTEAHATPNEGEVAVKRTKTVLGAAFAVLLLSALVAIPFAVRARTVNKVATPAAHAAAAGPTQTATIDGSAGGTVKCASLSVVVPPGAYRGTGTITVAASGPELQTVNLGISPASLNAFLVPVKLVYKKVDAGENVAGESIFWWNPATGAWEPAPNQSGDVVNGTLTSGLLHFSTYSVFKTRAGW